MNSKIACILRKSAASPPYYSQDSFQYFKDIASIGMYRPEFLNHWSRLMARPLSPFDLTTVIANTTKAFKLCPSGDQKGLQDWLRLSLRDWEEKATQAIDRFDARNLTRSLWSFKAMGIRPSVPFLEAWEAKAERCLSRFNATDISSALCAYACMALPLPPALWQGLQARANEIKESFSPRDQCDAIWALAVLNAVDSRLDTKHLAAALYSRVNVQELGMENTRQVAHAALWFGFECGARFQQERDTKSYLEITLSKIFKAAGLQVGDSAGFVRELGHETDIAFRIKGHPFLVEVDGNTHFVMNPDGGIAYNGKTLFQSALIYKCQQNARLIRFRYPELDRMKDERQAFRSKLAPLLAAAARSGPGIYSTFAEPNGSFNLKQLLTTKRSEPAPVMALA